MGYRTPQPPPLVCACQFGQLLVSKGAPPLRVARAPSDALPAYRGPRLPPPSRGRVTHGPGPGIPGAVLGAALVVGCVRRLTRRGEARCVGPGGSDPDASRFSASSGSPPAPVPSRGRWAPRGHGLWGRLARGSRYPGVFAGFPEPRPDGWRERESARARRRTPFEGIAPRRRRSSRGGPPAEGAGQRPGLRGRVGRGRSASRASRGRPRVWRWDPRARFPGGPSASSFLSRGLPPRVRPFSSRAPVLSARPPPRRRRFAPSRPGASRGRPPAARGCRPCPHIGRRAAAPPGGGPPRAR